MWGDIISCFEHLDYVNYEDDDDDDDDDDNNNNNNNNNLK
jgi:hypothetical protein